jgi:indolepyruvate decarboxylase
MVQAGAATLALAGGFSLVGSAVAPQANAQAFPSTVAGYILKRLDEHNVKHIFGVPGVTCDGVFEAAAAAGMDIVINASDLEAGYAAEGYARVRGLSAAAVTYGVGTLSLLAVVAGAYAERVPMIVLNGGPNASDLAGQSNLDVLFSHSTGKPDTDLAVFRPVTAAAIRINNTGEARAQIDGAIRTARIEQRPVYIEVNRDLWSAPLTPPSGPLSVPLASAGPESAMARDLLERIRGAERPMLLLGIEIARQRLGAEAEDVVRRLGVPYVTTLLSKSVIPETTPGFAGVFGSRYAPPAIRAAVEGSAPIIALGTVFGAQHREFVSQARSRLIRIGDGSIAIGSAPKRPANLRRVLAALKAELQATQWRPRPAWISRTALAGLSFEQRRRSIVAVQPSRPADTPATRGMTYDDAMSRVSAFLDDTFITITDTSLSMYPAADLDVKGARSFIANSVWQSIGYSVGAAVGVGIGQSRRPLVLVGDGGFQMTAQALSTLARRRVRAVVIVFDNALYAIEQFLLRRSFFANNAAPIPHLTLNRWDYAGLATALGCASGVVAETPAAFEAALQAARGADGPALIAVRIAQKDLPDGLPVA